VVRENVLTALAAQPGTRPSLLARQDLVAALVAGALEHPALFRAAGALLGVPAEAVATPAFKWARAVPPGAFTGVHADCVYFPGSAEAMLTAWLPLGDCPLASGGLLVALGSHRQRSAARLRARYFAQPLGADGTTSGWLAAAAARVVDDRGAPLRWAGADLASGDVIFLRMDVLHLTARNVSGEVRTSADTRWAATHARRDGLGVWRTLGAEAAGEEA